MTKKILRSAKKSNSPSKSPIQKVLQQARAAIKAGNFASDVLNNPEVIGALSEAEQLAVWRANRMQWLGEKGRQSIDDLYREERLACEFSGYKLQPANVLKRLKGEPSKRAKDEAEAHGGVVRWHTAWACPCVAFKFPVPFAKTSLSRWAVPAYGKRKSWPSAKLDAIERAAAELTSEQRAVLLASYDLIDEFQNYLRFHSIRPHTVRAFDWARLVAQKSSLDIEGLVFRAEDDLVGDYLFTPREGHPELTEGFLSGSSYEPSGPNGFIALGATFRLTLLGIEVAEYLID